MTFISEKNRNAYIVYPMHQAFTKLLPNIFDKVLVVDCSVNKSKLF
ncbi:MAG: hypothetical protein C0446_04980 [Chitinophaga sp.]|nr:hypothetical protein [Chitinophaga sp.]